MEFIRMGVVYAHLIACCVAIGLVFTSDISMLKALFVSEHRDHDRNHLPKLQRSVSVALAVLWISGISVIFLDAHTQGLGYFMNPKLQAKVAIVALLTLNGFALHAAVLPSLQKVGSILELEFAPRMVAIFTGVISAVSWFFAALLGIGRPLNWKYSLTEILGAFPLLIVSGCVAMLFITALAKFKRESGGAASGLPQ